MEQLVNAVIRRDVEELTGWNWLATSESILLALDINWFKLIDNKTREALKKLAINLNKVYKKYFIWQESDGKPPISVYTYVYENWQTILSEITEGLPTDYLEDPLGYEIRLKIELGLKDFANLLLQVGHIHKFNKQFIEENIFPDEEGDEE